MNIAPWGIILAGGDGTRLKQLSRIVSGDDRPKQFCAFVGGMTLPDRTRERVARAIAAQRTIKDEMEAAQIAALPASALGKAVGYTLSLWHKLTRFLEHRALELSNNLAENLMRGVALGRKNRIHVGSEQAGPKVAAILSVIESCRRLKLLVREYLTTVLPG